MNRCILSLVALVSLSGCGPRRDEPAAASPPPAPPPLTLTDAEGHACTPLADVEARTTVLLFLMHDCPVANASAPEIARLVSDFTTRGVRFLGVYAEETAEQIRTHLHDYSLAIPGLLDPRGELAARAGATTVPEAAVFSPAGELLYRGRIDDRAVQPGITKPVAGRHDLRLALEAILSGKAPDPKFTKAVGCYLPNVK